MSIMQDLIRNKTFQYDYNALSYLYNETRSSGIERAYQMVENLNSLTLLRQRKGEWVFVDRFVKSVQLVGGQSYRESIATENARLFWSPRALPGTKALVSIFQWLYGKDWLPEMNLWVPRAAPKSMPVFKYIVVCGHPISWSRDTVRVKSGGKTVVFKQKLGFNSTHMITFDSIADAHGDFPVKIEYAANMPSIDNRKWRPEKFPLYVDAYNQIRKSMACSK